MTGPSCYIETVVGADDFRRVCGHFATGVTIITTCERDGRPTGLTVSAFSSVSLDPPLVLVCVSHKSQSFPALRDGGKFAVNVLRESGEAVSRRFATTRLDKFDGVAYTLSPLGLPLLEDALAHVECMTVSAYPEGDHTIFVGRVEGARADSGHPLLYFRGQYQRLAPGCGGA